MITVSVYTRDGKMTGFRVSGHAEYAEHGSDIVCAAVSVLVLNTVNAVESFTEDVFTCEESEADGSIDFMISSGMSADTELLLKTLMLGLSGIQEEYGTGYIRFITKEV